MAGAVQAAIVVQAVFLVQGKPEALVNGKKVRPLEAFTVQVQGKTETVNVLEINKADNSVRLEYKGREFFRTMGGGRVKKP